MKNVFRSMMKRTMIGLAIMSLSGCVYVVDNTPGPPGLPGRAFYGVTYDYTPPYSYWDNNPSIPVNPVLNEYYPTHAGLYEFEYFVDPYEYWFGTYEIFRLPGGPGGPHGEPGYNGADTYLMMVCNPWGPYEWGTSAKTSGDEEIVIEKNIGNEKYIIKMRKAHVNERSAQNPKFKSK